MAQIRTRPKLLITPPKDVNRVFDESLLKKWLPLIRSLSKSFAIPGKLEPEDNEQELRLVLWELWQRVDPKEKPEDFKKLIKTEMKNRLIDLYRFHKAQKRSASGGCGIECLKCGAITGCTEKQLPVCFQCGEVGEVGKSTETTRWFHVQTPDVHFELAPENTESAGDDSGGGTLYWSYIAAKTSDPMYTASRRELVHRVRSAIAPFPDRVLFNLILDPTPQFVRLLLQHGYQADPGRAPYKIFSRHLGWSEKVLRLAHGRIGETLAAVLGRPNPKTQDD